jgi:regulator of replication initiation timing
MSSYVSQKVEEKTKQLHKLEQQLSEIPRQIELLQAELSALQDVLKHEERVPKAPARKAKSKRAKSRFGRAKPHKAATSSKSGSDGHWAELVRIYERAAKPFTIDDVENYLNSIGQPNMRKSIRAKLVVLVNKGVLKRESDGVFTVPPRGVSGDEMRAAGVIPRQARLVGEAA